MQRNAGLDALRGLMLVSMTLTHLPTLASRWSSQPFGFVSNAEGFVFLSAFLVGSIYWRRAAEGVARVGEVLGRRLVKLYGYHLLVLAFAFTVGAWIAIAGHRPGLAHLLDFYLARPQEALVDGLLLIYRPPLLDILPMYILFMAATPFVLAAGVRRGWGPILAASALVWLLAQFGVRSWAHDLVGALTGHPLPALRHMGAFNLYAWQSVWIYGLWLGQHLGRHPDSLRRLPAAWFHGALVVAGALLVMRYVAGGVPAHPLWLRAALGKWSLGPVRVLDFAALLLVCARYGGWWHARLPTRSLEFLGRSSLPVFAAHVLICLLAVALPRDDHEALAPLMQILLLVSAFSVLFAVAAIHQRERLLRPSTPIARNAQTA